ncbi:MAG TPA: hypothetical protein VFM38_09140 [Candidatus Limnocylindrales bacterium]|jgi:hypothetical protein|nr:hypothetical protein [Candidatus Limnocylindrales bacterium]
MAAYAVMARIGRADPHLTLHDVVDDDDGRHPPAGLRAAASDDVPVVESERASDPGPLAERLVRLHELWRQTTFYLFDAESWRA